MILVGVRLGPCHVGVPVRRPGVDLRGAGLLGAGLALILLPFIQGDWGPWRWCLLAGAATVLAAFVQWERRAADPVLDLRLFRNRSYTVGVSVITLYFAPFTPMFFLFPPMLHLGQG